jgi:hypothetical protein
VDTSGEGGLKSPGRNGRGSFSKSQAWRFGDVPAADAGIDAGKEARNDWVAKSTAKATSVVMKGVQGMLDWWRATDYWRQEQGISDLEKTVVRTSLAPARCSLLDRFSPPAMQGPQGRWATLASDDRSQAL